MKTRLALLASFFLITPIFVLSLVLYQMSLYQKPYEVKVLGIKTVEAEVLAMSIVEDAPETTSVSVEPQEGRVEVLREFFRRYNSPLENHAQEIVDAADKYGLDYRLLPAIAMQESTLCLKAPKGLNNCWGFGIYGKKRTAFDSLTTAINTVSKTLAEKYHAQGLKEPAEIMTKYTPSNDGEWAENVSYVMDRIAASM